MFGWSKKENTPRLHTDIHSHLIPGIDDGAQELEDSVEMIGELNTLGYRKAITTPHIHPNYPNSPDYIRRAAEDLNDELSSRKIDFTIIPGAEYFVDQLFFEKVKSNKDLLDFGDKFVLVESSFVNKPLFFETCMFELMSNGYRPILAHPERYRFLEGSLDWLHQLKEMGVLMQVTINSFVGYYGDTPQRMALKLAKQDMVDFLGSDLHRASQLKHLAIGLEKKKLFSSLKMISYTTDNFNKLWKTFYP